MKLSKKSKENTISFLFDEPDNTPDKKPTTDKKASVREDQKARKLSNKFDGENLKTMTNKSVFSAALGGVKDTGGTKKQMKSESSPNIWEPDKIEKMNQQKSEKEKTKEEKIEIQSNRRVAENERMNELVSQLKETQQGKTAEVGKMESYSGGKYQSPKNNMSIFGNQEFESLNEPTDGEKVSKEAQERRTRKDDSWKGEKKAYSNKDVINKMFDNLNFGE